MCYFDLQGDITEIQDWFVDGQKRKELIAEAIRDVGILFFVFGPLDTLLKGNRGNETDWLIASGVALAGIGLVAVGVVMGSRT